MTEDISTLVLFNGEISERTFEKKGLYPLSYTIIKSLDISGHTNCHQHGIDEHYFIKWGGIPLKDQLYKHIICQLYDKEPEEILRIVNTLMNWIQDPKTPRLS